MPTILLDADINASKHELTLDQPLTAQPGDLFSLADEIVEFGGFIRTNRDAAADGKHISVQRGRRGTVAASHAAGVELRGVLTAAVQGADADPPPDPFASGGPGNYNPPIPQSDVTGLVSALAAKVEADDLSLYVQPTDPGAVGAGALWIDSTTPGTTDLRVWKRNADDDGWQDLLNTYRADQGIDIEAGGDGQQVALSASAGTLADGGHTALYGGAKGGGDGARVQAGGATDGSGGDALVEAGSGDEDVAGGIAKLSGGSGNDGDAQAAHVYANGGDATTTPGKVELKTGGSTGPGMLVSDGTLLTYALAAFVEPTTATPEAIANALIAAGLMAPS